jgi:hypothetical protein
MYQNWSQSLTLNDLTIILTHLQAGYGGGAGGFGAQGEFPSSQHTKIMSSFLSMTD